MQDLLQARTLKSAGMAALASAFACYPRLSLWPDRPAPLWFLEVMLFLCSLVLWAFVFAWHTPYTRRPIFTLRIEPGPFTAVTLIGLTAAVVFHLFLDPSLRPKMPEEYPADQKQWFASLLFSLFFLQLFLFFAPFAWLMRLVQNRWVATVLTVLFGVFVLVLKFQSLPTPLPVSLTLIFLAGRAVMGLLAVWFYLRGGVVLIWWWVFLFEARNFLYPGGNP